MKVLTVNLSELLNPISGDLPCGSSLRYEGEYDSVMESRRQDDPGLDQGVWATDLKKANWANVENICTEALKEKSKDLQFAAWLMEAWMNLYGFAGVERGLALLDHLCRQFWENLFPLNDGNDWEPRLAPFYWINEKLSIQLKLIPICQPQHGDLLAYSFADWEVASKNENLIRKGQLEINKNKKTLNQPIILKSCNDSSSIFYEELAANLDKSSEHLKALGEFLDDKIGKQSPSLLSFSTSIEQILHLVKSTIKPKFGIEVKPKKITENSKPDSSNKTKELILQEDASLETTIQSRAQAYQLLNEIAHFLLKTEPHSPTPYLVRRAVSWGDMTLVELLREIVKDQKDIRIIYDLLGITDISEE